MKNLLKKIKSIPNKTLKRGITLLIAVIAVSALFLIAMAISDISYKEQVISYSGRDSKVAFYAADLGMECALYYDLKGADFTNGTTSTPFNFATTSAPTTQVIACGNVGTYTLTNQGTAPFSVVTSGTVSTSTFFFNYTDPVTSIKSCSYVRVVKAVNGAVVGTIIESRGYNNNCNAPTVTDPPRPMSALRNFERSLRVTY